MKIVVVTRYFESVPESDCVILDLDLCSTQEELQLRTEIERCLNQNEEFLNPSGSTREILSGGNYASYIKLNFLCGPSYMTPMPVKGTICYGPTILM